MRRHEQLPVLRQLALGEQREDLAAAVRDDHARSGRSHGVRSTPRPRGRRGTRGRRPGDGGRGRGHSTGPLRGPPTRSRARSRRDRRSRSRRGSRAPEVRSRGRHREVEVADRRGVPDEERPAVGDRTRPTSRAIRGSNGSSIPSRKASSAERAAASAARHASRHSAGGGRSRPSQSSRSATSVCSPISATPPAWSIGRVRSASLRASASTASRHDACRSGSGSRCQRSATISRSADATNAWVARVVGVAPTWITTLGSVRRDPARIPEERLRRRRARHPVEGPWTCGSAMTGHPSAPPPELGLARQVARPRAHHDGARVRPRSRRRAGRLPRR